MSDTVALALIAAAPGILAAVAAIIIQLRTAHRVNEVHQLVNGLAHEKDAAVDKAARKEGELAGRDFERRRRDDGGTYP